MKKILAILLALVMILFSNRASRKLGAQGLF